MPLSEITFSATQRSNQMAASVFQVLVMQHYSRLYRYVQSPHPRPSSVA